MRKLRRFVIATVLVSFSAFAVWAQSEAQMEEDAEELHQLYKKVYAIRDFRLSENVWNRIGENYPAFQRALDGMNKTALMRDDKKAYLESFSNKYASGETEQYKAVRAITNKFRPLDLGYDVGFEYEQILFRFEILDAAGPRNASTIIKHINDYLDNPSRLQALHEIYRVKAIEEFKSLITIIPLFAPSSERVKRRVNRLVPKIDEAAKKYKAEEMKVLQSRTWKGNIGSTSAGSPSSLAAAGKRFMTNQPDWGGNKAKGTKILKVSIIGDWFVAERSFGIPTRYGLPAAIAVSDNSMDPGVVTVYEVSLITSEGKKNTNFYGVWVGKVWRMLGKNLPR